MLKKNLLKIFFLISIVDISNAADTPPVNKIEKITIRVDYKVGETAPQYFTQQLNYKIISIFDCKQNPIIGGVVKSSGVGTTIIMHEIRASGYPGSTASSDITCQVMH